MEVVVSSVLTVVSNAVPGPGDRTGRTVGAAWVAGVWLEGSWSARPCSASQGRRWCSLALCGAGQCGILRRNTQAGEMPLGLLRDLGIFEKVSRVQGPSAQAALTRSSEERLEQEEPSHCPGGWKWRIRVAAGLAFPKASLLGSATSSMASGGHSPRVCVLSSCHFRHQSYWINHFNLTSPVTHVSKYG